MRHTAIASALALLTTLPLAWKWGLGVARVALATLVLSLPTGLVVAFVGGPATLGPVGAVAATWAGTLAAAIALLAYRFYRDPERRVPDDQEVVVSPAEGEVVYVQKCEAGELPVATKHGRRYQLEELTKTPLRSEDAVVIGISMSFLDVHVNRAPVPGTVTLRRHFPGRFGSLRRPEAVFDNERATTVIDRGDLEVGVVQIASRLVRQIVSFVGEGDTVALGQRTGAIRLGSQVDVVLPARPDLKVTVKRGDHVRAGESILAVCPASSALDSASLDTGSVAAGGETPG